ncbi:unnamed protein product [Calicophoron daubneyi]|uniref:E3 ubiquitin-protein ligase n=1 Tax=Calicophoron daubneyi TaxID=300641 RepID=A0AAV2TGR9_CALDB
MEGFFDQPDTELKDAEEFINQACLKYASTKEEFRTKFCDACINKDFESPIYEAVQKIFSYDCFSADRFRMKKTKINFLTKFFEFLIAGDLGVETMGRKLKEYDYSARCSLVWTTNYFAYRCRTCGLSPSMSLCSSCFTAGNHIGHDFNKFKSVAGGACDCGDQSVMKPSGYCRYHGPDKVNNRPSPPEELVAPLRCLLPRFLPALLYWLWELCSDADPTNLTKEVAPALFVLHVLHACGWVTQKMIADVLIDKRVYEQLVLDSAETNAFKDYRMSVMTNPGFDLPPIIQDQHLVHRTLLDAFIFCTIKLRFPESLVTFLIGLLAMDEFKEEFVQSYLNHYTRVASTVMISARTRLGTDYSVQLNNRIVHISVQLFSGKNWALRMVRERHLHYLLVHCLLNMFVSCRTRLDDRSNMVVNCDGPLIQNNVFWPFVSDLNNLVSHKPIVDVFVEDQTFLKAWTDVLRYMQFMNCFVMKEGNHIEYETMAFYHAFTMEIEIGATPMWSIWQHYREPSERHRCILYTKACLSSLANLLGGLGRLVSPTVQATHPIRSPLSLHLPLMRHASCFLSSALMQHKVDLKELLSEYLYPKPHLLRRFMNEVANTLLGCQEVIVGYWIRNGQALRQTITHYMQSQFCYSFIDLDIFALQMCATLSPPAYLLNALVDRTRLLRGICFHNELLSLVAPPQPRNLDRKPMALEAWLINLCWVLDLRNNICLTEDELLKKELLCVLAPEQRKRSDLSSLIPERCGISGCSGNLDEILKKVATYSGPSCDEASGSLISGHYFLRPSLWHTDFDPIFHSLRVTSRRETAVAMEKYREHCRQRHGVSNPSVLWPPFRTPKQLPPSFMGLDHVLHSRHLHYLLFIQLSLFVYGDPLVTEESLSIIIHLLDRALDTPCRTDAKRRKCCGEAYNLPPGHEPMHIDRDAKAATTVKHQTDEPMEVSEPPFDDRDDEQSSDDLTHEDLTSMDEDENNYEDAAFIRNLGLYLNEDDNATEGAETSTAQNPFFRFRGLRRGGSRSSHKHPPGIVSSTTLSQPQWDVSLVSCPYQPRTSLQDNLGCWLAVYQSPEPHVALAPTVLATQSHMPRNIDPVISLVPVLEPSVSEDEKSSVLVDSIISLLIKAHARLHWSRVSGSTDAVPKVAVGASFTDPNTAALHLADSNATSVGEDFPGLNEQVQANNITSTGLFRDFRSGTPVRSSSARKIKIAPRAMAVLGGGGPQASAIFGSSNNMASSADDTIHPSGAQLQSSTLTPDAVIKLPPELRYFAAGPPAYMMPDEKYHRHSHRQKVPPLSATDSGSPCPDPSDVCYTDQDRQNIASGKLCTAFGDGAYWIERLLDKIVSNSRGNEAAVRLYLTRARRPFVPSVRILRLQPMDSLSSSLIDTRDETTPPPLESTDKSSRAPPTSPTANRGLSGNESPTSAPMNAPSLSAPTPGAAAATREERKRAAQERRKRLMEQMASKQKAFATSHLKDLELVSRPSDTHSDTADNKESSYECVICQTAGTAANDDMVLLDMMCESGTMLQMREISTLPELRGRRMTQASGISALGQAPCCLSATRPPSNSPEVGGDMELAEDSAIMTPANSSGQAPTGTVGVSVLATNFDPGAPGQPNSFNPSPLSAHATPSPNSSVAPSPLPTYLLTSPLRDANTIPPAATSDVNSPPNATTCFVEYRRWWSLALPPSVSKHLPLLRPGLILQTCGHVVHRECFQRYRTQGAARTGPSRARSWVSCPLCRREVHHLLPLLAPAPVDNDRLQTTSSSHKHISMLENTLSALSPRGGSVWDDLNGTEDEETVHRRTLMSRLMGDRFEAAILLRSQLECEISVLMSCPSQYPIVSRRCSWREFICYIRRIYRQSSDLLNLLGCLTEDEAPTNPGSSESSTQFPHVFALCQDPADILLSLVPHIWPREDLFLTLVSACLSLAYIRALISVVLNRPDSITPESEESPVTATESLIGKLSEPLSVHLQKMVSHLRTIEPLITPNQKSSEDQKGASESSVPQNYHLLLEAAHLADTVDVGTRKDGQPLKCDQAWVEMYIVLHILPLLRLAALCLAKWQRKAEGAVPGKLVPTGLPFVGQSSVVSDGGGQDYQDKHYEFDFPCGRLPDEQRLLEFSDLCRILSLECGDTAVANVALVAELAASRSGLLPTSETKLEFGGLAILMARWIGQFNSKSPKTVETASEQALSQSDLSSSQTKPKKSSLFDVAWTSDQNQMWIKCLPALVEVGRQLYPPRLIRTPYSFDTLFNALHLIGCDAVQHRFQENALCLICGRLLCTLCTNLSTVMVEHAYSCEGFAGIILEINTSIVYVSLGSSVCDWGSIYLDDYGEEDLELKRGKPLFLNAERFALLENQWLSHSFRHVLKHWRVV